MAHAVAHGGHAKGTVRQITLAVLAVFNAVQIRIGTGQTSVPGGVIAQLLISHLQHALSAQVADLRRDIKGLVKQRKYQTGGQRQHGDQLQQGKPPLSAVQ